MFVVKFENLSFGLCILQATSLFFFYIHSFNKLCYDGIEKNGIEVRVLLLMGIGLRTFKSFPCFQNFIPYINNWSLFLALENQPWPWWKKWFVPQHDLMFWQLLEVLHQLLTLMVWFNSQVFTKCSQMEWVSTPIERYFQSFFFFVKFLFNCKTKNIILTYGFLMFKR